MGPRTLFFDIETSPIKVWTFCLGEQHISHDRIVNNDTIDIICITYCWDKGPAHALTWDKKQDSTKMIQEFDKIAAQADVLIGHNSDNFDIKHINTQRLLKGLPPMPHWASCTDDTLKQVKRHFKFLSNKLDYISGLFGYGGKNKMSLKDWIAIKEHNCPEALAKMVRYGKKDVLDTRKTFNKIKPYITPKFNHSVYEGTQCCRSCGSKKVSKNGTRMVGVVKKQRFICSTCKGFAGYATLTRSGGILK